MIGSIIIQQLFNGIAQGSAYALVAIGYVLIYGGLRKMNFAHSDVYMVGGMCAYTLYGFVLATCENMLLQIGAGLVVGMLGGMCIGWFIEKVAFKPLRFAPTIANSLCTMGFSFMLKEAGRMIWGSDTHRFVRSTPWLQYYRFPEIGLTITSIQILMLVVAVILVVILELFLYKTNTGRAVRAISINPTAAQLMGVNMDRVISVTFMLASSLSAAAGVLVGFYYNVATPYMGAMPGMKAFAAIVFGGITSIPGAVVGGLSMGLLENIGSMFIGDSWRDCIAYAVFFLVLIIRPQGIFGKKEDIY